MKKKVFASDFDGTLYFYKAEVKLPPENVAKIKEYQAAGNYFGLCTGRQVGGLTPFIGGYFDPDFWITSTGSNIIDKDMKGIRKLFVDRDVIDKIVKIVLSDAVRRSLWIACDEVIGHGGKVLLLSNRSAHDLFKEDKDLMDLFFTGLIKQIWAEEMKGFKSKGLRISVDSHCSTDTRPFKDYYRTVIIDDIKTKYGNLAIKWHSPELANRELCLYFKDGQWLYDGKDGWCSDSEAKAVLRAAVDKFVDGAKRTEHDAHHFFGWGW